LKVVRVVLLENGTLDKVEVSLRKARSYMSTGSRDMLAPFNLLSALVGLQVKYLG
jgi:hypothetical protein